MSALTDPSLLQISSVQLLHSVLLAAILTVVLTRK